MAMFNSFFYRLPGRVKKSQHHSLRHPDKPRIREEIGPKYLSDSPQLAMTDPDGAAILMLT